MDPRTVVASFGVGADQVEGQAAGGGIQPDVVDPRE